MKGAGRGRTRRQEIVDEHNYSKRTILWRESENITERDVGKGVKALKDGKATGHQWS